MILWELDGGPLVSSLRALPGHLDDTVERALARSLEAVAFTARAEHPYTNRTGDLEASTEADAVSGRFTGAGLHGAVVAGMPYATHVEDLGYAFLMPALEQNRGRLEQEFFDALEQAVARSDLR